MKKRKKAQNNRDKRYEQKLPVLVTMLHAKHSTNRPNKPGNNKFAGGFGWGGVGGGVGWIEVPLKGDRGHGFAW